MKKYCLDLEVKALEHLNDKYVLLRLTQTAPLPEMVPGQFVEIKVEGSESTFLRRPISINDFDREHNELHLLIACIGDGTRKLGRLNIGERVSVVLPLGNGFTLPASPDKKHLLVGGGVGVAPLLYLGKEIRRMGGKPYFLLGARSGNDLLLLEEFRKTGEVYITTEDGTEGEKGFVTNHSVLEKERFDMISTCGPKPMMLAVARYAHKAGIDCEVSLENKMACGVGACLCCVEDTTDGHVCVCKDGPVININKLKWQI